MPVYLEVEARADQRSFKQVADQAKKEFGQAGQQAGSAFTQKMAEGMRSSDAAIRKSAESAQKAYDKAADAVGKVRVEEAKLAAAQASGNQTRVIAQAEALEKARRAQVSSTRLAAVALRDLDGAQTAVVASGSRLSNLLTNVSNVAGGTQLGNMAGQASTLAARMGGLGVAAAGVTAGIAGIAVAAVAAGVELYAVGERWDAVGDNIAIRTGKIGADLDAMTTSMANVSTKTASSIEDIAGVGVSVSQAFQLSGAPLEDLTKRIADLNRMTGDQINIREFGKTMRGFGETDAPQMLNELTTVFQETGIPLNELIATMGDLGPAARTLGLDFDATAGLIVAFEKAGLDASKTAAGLGNAAKVFADSNIPLQSGLADTITQLRGFIDAGNDAAAIDLAGKVFGEKNAKNFVDAIRQGTLDVNTLNRGLGTTGDTVADLDKKTADWSEQWTKLTNQIDVLAGKIGGPLFDAVNTVLAATVDLIDAQTNASHFDMNQTGPPPPPSTPITSDSLIPGLLGGPGSPTSSGGAGGLLLPNLNSPLAPGAAPPPGSPALPGGPAGTGQDIAGAIDDAKKAGAGGAGGGLPQAPVLPLQYSQVAPGTSAAIANAQTRADEAAHKLAEKQARVTQLEQSNVATADDVTKAKNDVVEAERDVLAADQALQESKSSAFEKQSKQLRTQASDLGQIGASIDKDFGISKGLSGIAENITKFIANMAAAPLLGKLGAVSATDPTQGGYGLMGVLGAQGAFGPQYQNNQYATSGGAGGGAGYQVGAPSAGGYYPAGAPTAGAAPGGAYGMPAGTNSGGYGGTGAQFPDWVNQMAARFGLKPSTYPGHQESDRNEAGYAPNPSGENRGIDWSGSPQDMQRFADYLAANPGSLEQVIWNGAGAGTGASVEIAGGRPQPGYFAGDLPGHGYHVHTRQSSPIPLPGSGGGTGTGAGFPGLAGPPQAGPTTIGGLAPKSGTGKGGIGMSGGGALDMAMQAGGMALDALAPGAGQAAQTGMKLINRAIEYGGQVAGIGVSGLMETFLPTGGSELAGNNWITRIVGGLAGAAPALPNLAGEKKPPEGQAGQHGAQAGQPPGPTFGDINVTTQREDGAGQGRDLAYNLQNQYAAPGM